MKCNESYFQFLCIVIFSTLWRLKLIIQKIIPCFIRQCDSDRHMIDNSSFLSLGGFKTFLSPNFFVTIRKSNDWIDQSIILFFITHIWGRQYPKRPCPPTFFNFGNVHTIQYFRTKFHVFMYPTYHTNYHYIIILGTQNPAQL